jgi:cytochrome c-type biogenesis protein
MSFTHLFSAALAGLLTSLSPCVLSALPLVVTSAIGENKKGPLALAAGLISSFVLLGVIFAIPSTLLGADKDSMRGLTAIIFIFIGLILAFPGLSQKLGSNLGPLSNKANSLLNKLNTEGLTGQFIVGFFLGVIWSPCSGPTLGLAFTLVNEQQAFFQSAILMLIFGVFAVLPLLAIAYGSKKIVLQNMNNLQKFQSRAKFIMGIVLIILGILTFTDLDRTIEAYLTNLIPNAMLDIITRF